MKSGLKLIHWFAGLILTAGCLMIAPVIVFAVDSSRFRPAFSQMLGENRLGSISFDGGGRADGYGFRFSGSFQEI